MIEHNTGWFVKEAGNSFWHFSNNSTLMDEYYQFLCGLLALLSQHPKGFSVGLRQNVSHICYQIRYKKSADRVQDRLKLLYTYGASFLENFATFLSLFHKRKTEVTELLFEQIDKITLLLL